MKILRPKPDYFAVGYYGQGYPPFLRVGQPSQCLSLAHIYMVLGWPIMVYYTYEMSNKGCQFTRGSNSEIVLKE